MTPGVWKHNNTLDMCIWILAVPFKSKKYIKAKVKYIDSAGRLLHEETETVKIFREDFWQWHKI